MNTGSTHPGRLIIPVCAAHFFHLSFVGQAVTNDCQVTRIAPKRKQEGGVARVPHPSCGSDTVLCIMHAFHPTTTHRWAGWH